MDLKKFVPWNWFKKEENDTNRVPVNYSSNRFEASYPDQFLPQLQKEVDRFYDAMLDFMGISSSAEVDGAYDSITQGLLKPRLDIATDESAYNIKIELPGVELQDIQLETTERTLTVKGEKRREKKETKKNYYRVERSYGSFQRTLNLPEDADQDAIDASFKNGVLTITIAKNAQAETKMKQIDIQ